MLPLVSLKIKKRLKVNIVASDNLNNVNTYVLDRAKREAKWSEIWDLGIFCRCSLWQSAQKLLAGILKIKIYKLKKKRLKFNIVVNGETVANTLEVSRRRVKRGEIRDSGVHVEHLWSTFYL